MKTFLSREQQISRTLALWRYKLGHGPSIQFSPFPLSKKEPYRLIVVRQHHRLFRVGDIAWMFFNNHQAERWPVYAISSKGFWVDGFYLKYAGWRGAHQFAPKQMDFVELPDHLVTIMPDSPDVQQHLLQLAESYVQDMPLEGKHG